MTRFTAILFSLPIGACIAAEPKDPELFALRNLAATMIKNKDLGGNKAYCEYAPITQVHGCSGPSRNAIRYRAHPDGTIESNWYRSPSEAGYPIGFYRGRMKPGDWRDLLMLLTQPSMPKTRIGMPRPQPPGPSETIKVLTLSDGMTEATYATAEPAPGPAEEAFDRLGILAQTETDTIWELSLVQPHVVIHKDSLVFTARWKWRGPTGTRLIFSNLAGGGGCGQAQFKWYLDTSTFTVDWHYAVSEAKVPKVWEIASGPPSWLRLTFAYDGPSGKAKRIGGLNGIGIRLIPGDGSDTVSATVFSDNFNF